MKFIAVEGCTLQFDGIMPMTLSSCQLSPASQKIKVGAAGVYRETITVSAVFATTGTPPTLQLSFSIDGSAGKTKADGQPVVLESDTSGAVLWSYAVGQTTVSGSATCKIQAAGQQKVSAN
ncbi:MAG: hypothetical protein Pg6A_20250 [Termitinemataceae bacterium]|nr:MAG: hypothetical protein Pg6A_20250 [Termitinemataceae bacterium]